MGPSFQNPPTGGELKDESRIPAWQHTGRCLIPDIRYQAEDLKSPFSFPFFKGGQVFSSACLRSSHLDLPTPATFGLIVETTRRIIDAVKPKRNFFTLEAMPWAYPDSVDSYLNLLRQRKSTI